MATRKGKKNMATKKGKKIPAVKKKKKRAAASDFIAIIPARYGSSRFPGKALADIDGKPMVVRVAERAASSGAKKVIVATDDKRIVDAARIHGFDVVLTRDDHETGTDRLAEVVTALNLADDIIVVNVQGDEPLIAPGLINDVAKLLDAQPKCTVATAAYRFQDPANIFNPNIVKVIVDNASRALYFSRAPVPWVRNCFVVDEGTLSLGKSDLPATLPMLHHIGIYAYRAGFLKLYPTLTKVDIEEFEALEQLRALWHGYRIAVHIAETEPLPGVDHPDDLAAVLALWPNRDQPQ